MHDELLGDMQTGTVKGEMIALDMRGKLGGINCVLLFETCQRGSRLHEGNTCQINKS